MFRPNFNCTVFVSSGTTDVYGQPLPSTAYKERCSIIKLNVTNEKSSVRADSSASRGAARELETNSVILLTKTTRAAIDDVVEVNSMKIRVTGKFPRHDLQGALDHYEISGTYWSEQ
jgi:hypothetical protein